MNKEDENGKRKNWISYMEYTKDSTQKRKKNPIIWRIKYLFRFFFNWK